jgi:hypothetical protein
MGFQRDKNVKHKTNANQLNNRAKMLNNAQEAQIIMK